MHPRRMPGASNEKLPLLQDEENGGQGNKQVRVVFLGMAHLMFNTAR